VTLRVVGMCALELASLAIQGAAVRPAYAQSGVPIPVSSIVIEPGTRLKLTAHGPIPPTLTPPNTGGASLIIVGATGSARRDFPAGGWSARAGRLRYRDAVCTVTFRYAPGATPEPAVRAIRVSCKGATGTLAAAEPGPVMAVLQMQGDGSDPDGDRYCAQCGGTLTGNPATGFRAKNCSAPPECSTTDCRLTSQCPPPDACHQTGICHADGTCSYLPVPDGTTCDDADPCTSNDTCQSGSCTGVPVTCPAPDQCHQPGVCGADGTCSSLPLPDGTTCDDADPCTSGDACQSGVCRGAPFTCGPPDQCHQSGTCNGDGTCSYLPVSNGTACDDGDPCTLNDACQAGSCAGVPVVCTPPDPCQTGTCSSDGTCAYQPLPDGTPCTQGGDLCVGGVCTEVPPLASLSVSPLTLRPAFAPAIHDYAVLCSTGTNSLTLDMSAMNGGTVALSAPTTTAPAPSASVPVSLAENQAAVVQAEGANGASEEYWIRCLPHDFPLVSPTTHPAAGSPTPGWYVIGNVFVAPGYGKFAMIIDANGTPVWYHRTSAAPTVVTALPGSTVGITLLANPPAVSTATLYQLPSSTTVGVQTVGVPLDDHELQELPNGDFMLLSYPTLSGVNLSGLATYTCTNCTMFDCAVQEVDPSGNLVWDWRASDHTDPVQESVVPSGAGTTTSPADVYHCNSIDVNADGDVLVSFRHMDAVLLISGATGNVVWKLGGTAYNKDGAEIVTIQGDAEGGLSGQHDARFRPNGNISLFDDHTSFAGTTVTGPARGVEFALDLGAGTAGPVWEYPAAAMSGALGSFRSYPDGTRLIGWGQYMGSGNLVFTETDAAGNDLLDMTFASRGNWSYRAEKVPLAAFDVEVLRNTAGLP
jgi:hypothetical protein